MINKIILASSSGVRKKILNQNNISPKVIPANIDEDQIKESLQKEKATPQIISKNLNDIGIKSRVKTQDFGAWFNNLQTGTFSAAIGWTEKGATPYPMFEALMASKNVKLVGSILDIKERSNKDGKKYAFITVSNQTHQFEILDRMSQYPIRLRRDQPPSLPKFHLHSIRSMYLQAERFHLPHLHLRHVAKLALLHNQKPRHLQSQSQHLDI